MLRTVTAVVMAGAVGASAETLAPPATCTLDGNTYYSSDNGVFHLNFVNKTNTTNGEQKFELFWHSENLRCFYKGQGTYDVDSVGTGEGNNAVNLNFWSEYIDSGNLQADGTHHHQPCPIVPKSVKVTFEAFVHQCDYVTVTVQPDGAGAGPPFNLTSVGTRDCDSTAHWFGRHPGGLFNMEPSFSMHLFEDNFTGYEYINLPGWDTEGHPCQCRIDANLTYNYSYGIMLSTYRFNSALSNDTRSQACCATNGINASSVGEIRQLYVPEWSSDCNASSLIMEGLSSEDLFTREDVGHHHPHPHPPGPPSPGPSPGPGPAPGPPPPNCPTHLIRDENTEIAFLVIFILLLIASLAGNAFQAVWNKRGAGVPVEGADARSFLSDSVNA